MTKNKVSKLVEYLSSVRYEVIPFFTLEKDKIIDSLLKSDDILIQTISISLSDDNIELFNDIFDSSFTPDDDYCLIYDCIEEKISSLNINIKNYLLSIIDKNVRRMNDLINSALEAQKEIVNKMLEIDNELKAE